MCYAMKIKAFSETPPVKAEAVERKKRIALVAHHNKKRYLVD